MIRAALVLCGLVAGVQPAHALSCLRPDIAQTFADLDAAPETYVMARGTITLDDGEVVRPGYVEDAEDYDLAARFQGHVLTPDGPGEAVDSHLTVEVRCAGPWCGAPPEDASVLFLETRDGALYFTANACPGNAFAATPEIEARATACLRGEGCEPEG